MPERESIEIDERDILKLFSLNEQDRQSGIKETMGIYDGDNYADAYCTDGLYREILDCGPMTTCFKIQFPHGIILKRSRRRHFL